MPVNQIKKYMNSNIKISNQYQYDFSQVNNNPFSFLCISREEEKIYQCLFSIKAIFTFKILFDDLT